MNMDLNFALLLLVVSTEGDRVAPIDIDHREQMYSGLCLEAAFGRFEQIKKASDEELKNTCVFI